MGSKKIIKMALAILITTMTAQDALFARSKKADKGNVNQALPKKKVGGEAERAPASAEKKEEDKVTAVSDSKTNQAIIDAEEAYTPAPSKTEITELEKKQLYPYGALNQLRDEELDNYKRTEEIERKQVEISDKYEQEKKDAEIQIARKKYQIEGYKLRQKDAEAQIRILNTDLKYTQDRLDTTEKQLQAVEQDSKATESQYQTIHGQLEGTRTKLQETLENLKQQKEKAERAYARRQVEIQRMRTEISGLETDIARADARKTAVEADEMKARADWLIVKKQIEDKMNEKKAIMAQLDEARKKYEKANASLQSAKNDLSNSEKDKNQLLAKVQGEIAKYEKEIESSKRSKDKAEEDRVRIEAETEKWKTHAAKLKEARDKATEESSEASTFVIRSAVELETAKAEKSQEEAKSNIIASRREKSTAQVRGLASAAEAAQVLEGARPYIVVKDCNIHRKPASEYKIIGQFESGKSVLGQVSEKENWIKVQAPNGADGFIEKYCIKREGN
jgi:chromosome segregation ATPase